MMFSYLLCPIIAPLCKCACFAQSCTTSAVNNPAIVAMFEGATSSLLLVLRNASIMVQSNYMHHPVRSNCCSGGAAAAIAVEKLAGSSHLLQAAAWKLAGNRSLAEASVLTHLACYQDAATSADQAVAYAQLAQIAMSKKGYR